MAGGEGKRGSSGKVFVVAGMAVAAPLLTVVVVLLSLVILVVAILQSDYGLGTRCVTGSSSWVDWAVSVAKDDSHGYSQPNRGGDPDYDCSSFVWAALRHAGFDVGSSPFNTDGMDSVLKAAGFERSDFRDVASLQAGDVVWADGHTEIYMGDGEFVGAHWDERHGVEGRTPGDQTGDEIGVTSTLNARYTRVYRAPASQGSQAVARRIPVGTGWARSRRRPPGSAAWPVRAIRASRIRRASARGARACAPTVWGGSMWDSIGAMAACGPRPRPRRVTG